MYIFHSIITKLNTLNLAKVCLLGLDWSAKWVVRNATSRHPVCLPQQGKQQAGHPKVGRRYQHQSYHNTSSSKTKMPDVMLNSATFVFWPTTRSSILAAFVLERCCLVITDFDQGYTLILIFAPEIELGSLTEKVGLTGAWHRIHPAFKWQQFAMAGIKVLNIKKRQLKNKLAGLWSEWFDPEQGNQTVGDDYNQRPQVFNFLWLLVCLVCQLRQHTGTHLFLKMFTQTSG